MRAMYLLFAAACLSDVSGNAGSWSAIPSPDASADIWGVAADSGILAVQTGDRIWLSGNRGLDWRDLGPNKFPKESQRIHLSRSHLFASMPDSRRLYRYSFALAEWDSLLLPEFDYLGSPPPGSGYVYSPTGVFAAAGNTAAFAAVVDGRPVFFLSSDGGGHFDSAGIAPFSPEARLGLGLALSEDGIVMAHIDQGVGTWKSTDGGKSWKGIYGCDQRFGGFSASLCAMRSRFWFLEWSGKILPMGIPGACPDSLPGPPERAQFFGGENSPSGLRYHPRLAASGGSLLYSFGKSMWMFDAAPAAPILSLPRASRARVSTGLDVLGRPRRLGPGVLPLLSREGGGLRSEGGRRCGESNRNEPQIR